MCNTFFCSPRSVRVRPAAARSRAEASFAPSCRSRPAARISARHVASPDEIAAEAKRAKRRRGATSATTPFGNIMRIVAGGAVRGTRKRLFPRGIRRVLPSTMRRPGRAWTSADRDVDREWVVGDHPRDPTGGGGGGVARRTSGPRRRRRRRCPSRTVRVQTKAVPRASQRRKRRWGRG